MVSGVDIAEDTAAGEAKTALLEEVVVDVAAVVEVEVLGSGEVLV